MSNPLDAIRDELRRLRPRLASLEKAEQLLARTYEPPEAPPKPPHTKPRKASRTKPARKPHGANPTPAQIREFVIANGPVTRGEIVKALGGHPKSVGTNLKRLIENGEIVAEGKAPGRRYRAPDAVPPAVPNVTSLPTPPPHGTYAIYDAVAAHGPCTTARLVELTRLPKPQVVKDGRHLTRLGWMRFAERGGERVWMAVDAIGEAA